MARVPEPKANRPLSLRHLSSRNAWVWPALTLIALLLLWAFIAVQLGNDREQAVADALRHAQSVNRAYVQYVERTVRQLDQVTGFVVYQKDSGLTSQTLQELTRQVLVPSATPVTLSISDALGHIILTSGDAASTVNIDDREYFRTIARNSDIDAFVAAPCIGKISQKPSMQLARRLTYRDGTFAGVVCYASVTDKLLSHRRPWRQRLPRCRWHRWSIPGGPDGLEVPVG
jgi:hypothetical protein